MPSNYYWYCVMLFWCGQFRKDATSTSWQSARMFKPVWIIWECRWWGFKSTKEFILGIKTL